MNQKVIQQRFERLGASVVSINESPISTKIFLRVADEKEKWPSFVRNALHASDDAVRIDISKTFMLKEGSVIYLWRVVLATQAADTAEQRLLDIFTTLGEAVTEVRLTGASPRNAFWAHDGRAEAVIQPHFFTGGSR